MSSHQNGSPKSKDFRPISILHQHYLRHNVSEEEVLIKMRDDIMNTPDQGRAIIAILTYFSEAFDAVNYGILLLKVILTTYVLFNSEIYSK